jgi:formate hydrogenlyase subunit 4
MAFVGLLIPVFLLPSQSQLANNVFGAPRADFIEIVFLLGFTRFVIGLAGIDTGSPFAGIGTGRELYFHFLSEVTLLVSAFSLAIQFKTTSLSEMMVQQISQYPSLRPVGSIISPSLWIVILSLAIVALIETGRIPFDNPATHLELTMTGKAIHLEYGGWQLALLEWSDYMRLLFFILLLLNLGLPFTLPTLENITGLNILWLPFFLLKVGLTLLILAGWESINARMKLRAVITPAALSLALSIVSVFVAMTTFGN